MAMQATQSAFVMDAGKLSKVITVIGRQKVRIDGLIQTAAANVVAQSIVFRNSTPAQQLYDAVGTSSRRDALVKYLEKFGNLRWSKVEKRVMFYDRATTPIESDKAELQWSEDYSAKVHAFIWFKAKPEPTVVSSYDVEFKVSELIDALRKAARKGIKLENAELLNSVESLYVQYAAKTFDAKQAALLKATPALEGDELDKARDDAKDKARAESQPMSDRDALVTQMKGGVQLAA